MDVTLTILGSGTSHGIPMIGCDCAVCQSDNPRDKRTRSSALFSFNAHHLLIDAAPELRLQCLREDVRRVDAVFITHCHQDHIAGLDDLRIFTRGGRTLTVYSAPDALPRLRRSYDYAFEDDPSYPSAKPRLVAERVAEPFELFGAQVIPLPYWHGPTPVMGVRIGNIAYCTDCNAIPDETRALLTGLDVLILDGLRRTPHPTHFNLEQAVAEAKRIGARQTYFTHIAHELGHAATDAELPEGMALAYDGLRCVSRG
jgi:phosphoribosyl 1,2-cyclic phosphate phosphodiesterase